MRQKIWRKNNKNLNAIDEKELSSDDLIKYLQADVNSQLMWITVNTCKGIRCKDCYIKDYCKTKDPALSQELAGAIIKSAINGKQKQD